MIQQELSFPEITRIMDEIQEAGCLELCLTGGEPLARKDFLDIYAYAKQKGFLVTVFTNGTLLTEKITDYWTQYPPAMIEISLHGLTKESFERITKVPGSYERCMEAHVRRGRSLCGGGQYKFHIDAHGHLQLCSNNRRRSYDLRRGSFQEGFYKVLPQFPCPARQAAAPELIGIDRAPNGKAQVAVHD